MQLVDARPVVKIRLMVRVPGLPIKVEWKVKPELDTCPEIAGLVGRLKKLGY